MFDANISLTPNIKLAYLHHRPDIFIQPKPTIAVSKTTQPTKSKNLVTYACTILNYR